VANVCCYSSSTDPHSTQCITDLKHRLLKVAIDKQPQILTSVDNQEIKEILQQVIAGDDSSLLNVDQVQAVNDWLEQIAHEDNRKSSSTDPHSTQCITDLKHRLLKVAIDKQPQILTSVDNQEIKVTSSFYV
jgi:hypothetical protein